MKTGKLIETSGKVAVGVGMLTTIAGSQPPPLDAVHSTIQWTGCGIIIAGLLAWGAGYVTGRVKANQGE
jgi:hypothetical protein